MTSSSIAIGTVGNGAVSAVVVAVAVVAAADMVWTVHTHEITHRWADRVCRARSLFKSMRMSMRYSWVGARE